MWCDDFDTDLLIAVPGAVEALGAAAAVQLTTYSRLTGGKINHPSCWHTHEGIAAFFWTAGEYKPDPSYLADAPEAACTFLEAVRDEWVHGCLIIVDQEIVWQPPQRTMMRLMYDLRGWTPLSDRIREALREHVRDSLRAAAVNLGELVQL